MCYRSSRGVNLLIFLSVYAVDRQSRNPSAMVTDKPDISVILLCYRSEEAVWKYVEVLKRSLEEIKVSWEIILVGNYVEDSIDRTPEVVREIAD